MGLFNILDPILNVVIGPLINAGYLIALIVLALAINLLLLLIYKKTTNQELMKRLKDEMKELQNETKPLKDHPEKMMEVQRRTMETNMKYMKQSLKPNLYTFIPIIIILGWMSTQFAFLPIMPGDEFNVTIQVADPVKKVTMGSPAGLQLISNATQTVANHEARWTLKAKDEGLKTLQFQTDNEVTAQKNVLVTKERKYLSPVKTQKGIIDYIYGSSEYLTAEEKKAVSSITLTQKPILPLGNGSLFGWQPGWLGTYIILSIVLNLVLRKLLKLH